MKKLLLLAIALTALSANSQVKFKPGIRAGVNFSKFTDMSDVYFNDDDEHYIDREFTTDFYAGVTLGIKFTKRYMLQPEINYSRQGGKLVYDDGFNYDKADLEISYLSVAIMNKIYPGRRFNIEVGPYFDQRLSDNFDPDIDVDFGIIAGLGYEFNDHVGIEARFKKGVPTIYSDSDFDLDNLVISIGATFTL